MTDLPLLPDRLPRPPRRSRRAADTALPAESARPVDAPRSARAGHADHAGYAGQAGGSNDDAAGTARLSRNRSTKRTPAPPSAAAPDAALRVLFVGINPGVRSSQLGHHLAGHSNRFWKLLWDAGLTPRLATWADDVRMPEWGYGMTNLVPRPTRGIDELTPDEYRAGRARLEAVIARHRPLAVALLGVTLARSLLTRLDPVVGLQAETLAGAPVFVLPNPSGRNANFTYLQMLEPFRALREWIDARTDVTRG